MSDEGRGSRVEGERNHEHEQHDARRSEGRGASGSADEPSNPRPSTLDPVSASPVSRRQALKVLGAVPVAAALGSSAFAQQGQQQGGQQGPRTPHAGPNQPAQPGAQPAKNAATRKFFTAKEWRTVGVLADDVLPRDERGPSATEAGVPAYMDFQMSVPETTEASKVALRGGLAWLDTESRARFGKAYASLGTDQRHRILDDIAYPERAKPELRRGATFFSRFRDMTASGYFSSAAGWKDLRYMGNVFNPAWDGCPPAALAKLGVSYAMMDSRVKPQ
jgi:gluconate 2-dehydrogenase gamma chain